MTRPFKLSVSPDLKEIITQKLELKWLPEQISGWLRLSDPTNSSMWISHETIYKSLYIRSDKLLDSALMNKLHSGYKMRQSIRHSRRGDSGTIRIVNGTSYTNGPWKLNSVQCQAIGKVILLRVQENAHLATLVDRKSRSTAILKLSGKDSESVTSALVNEFNRMPKTLKKSLTWDRGMALAKHQEFTKKTGVSVYFCDP